MELDELYTELILQYSHSKNYQQPLLRSDVEMKGVNPSCGDDIDLELMIHEGMIQQLKLGGVGCAISQASANMMAELVEGKSVEEARNLVNLFLDMIQKKASDTKSLKALKNARAFQNISNMPARVKCAVLAWHTLDEALNKFENHEG